MHSVTDVCHTLLMWPWRVKMDELPWVCQSCNMDLKLVQASVFWRKVKWTHLNGREEAHEAGTWKNVPRMVFLHLDTRHLQNPKFQNWAIRVFWEKILFLTYRGEKTTLEWPKLVSETIFPTNWGSIKVVLNLRFGHWKCPNQGWGKGHFRSAKPRVRKRLL